MTKRSSAALLASVSGKLDAYRDRAAPPTATCCGHIVSQQGLSLVAQGCEARIGERCELLNSDGSRLAAEVVGFNGPNVSLMAIDSPDSITPATRVKPLGHGTTVQVGGQLLGRVINGAGVPTDGLGPLDCSYSLPLQGQAINPVHRTPIRQPLDVGVRAINALCTAGRGQRLGLFAGSGVGKSTLLALMARNTEADVVVVGLIGERGREVREFIEDTLGVKDRQRAVVVASPADDPPILRIHAAWRATTIAEYFRSQGLRVLLLMDSLTRFAQAHREVALSSGELPVSRGFPASVFVEIPRLLERAGTGCDDSEGSITGIYTVLVEGDDPNDPIGDASRAILDGHIVLSRSIAESGLYPAIDVDASLSRVMPAVSDRGQQQQAQKFRQIYATYQQNRDLISVGAYQAGSDAGIDQAIREYPRLTDFIAQGMHESASMDESLAALAQLSAAWNSAPCPD